MRILKVVNSTDTGGVFTCERQFINEFRNRGIQVELVILGKGEKLKAYTSMSDKSYNIPALKASYSGSVFAIITSIIKTYYFGYKQARRIYKQIGSQTKYDSIIYQKAIYIHLVGQLANLVNARSFWHLPNVARTAFSRNYYNYFCRHYGIVPIANSIYTQKTLGEHCKYVIYPGYDSVQVRDAEPILRQQLNLTPATPIYGIAARMQKDKAQDLVVEAFVKSDIPAKGGHLLIAGGPLNSEFARRVQEQAGSLLGKQVHFLGEVKEMPAFYASIDVAINGRRNVEPFGISIAEAMGAGKPVIAYKLGGPAEMINHTVNGWLVDNPTTDNYKEILNLSIANRTKWPEMGKAAKENSKNFRIEKNVDALLQIVNGND